MFKARVLRTAAASGILAGLFGLEAALRPVAAAPAGSNAGMPDLTMRSGQAWMEMGDELLPPPPGAGPITNDPRYPYVDNGQARRTASQPTYRVADLTIRSCSLGRANRCAKPMRMCWQAKCHSVRASAATLRACRASSCTPS